MLNICNKVVKILMSDPTLTSTVPVSSISVGPVDVIVQKQSELLMPQINIHPISESVSTVPLNTKDTRVQMDIWSRNSEMEVQTIYERVLILLNFQTYDQGGSHVFWQRLENTAVMYDTEVRLWHMSADFVFWSLN